MIQFSTVVIAGVVVAATVGTSYDFSCYNWEVDDLDMSRTTKRQRTFEEVSSLYQLLQYHNRELGVVTTTLGVNIGYRCQDTVHCETF